MSSLVSAEAPNWPRSTLAMRCSDTAKVSGLSWTPSLKDGAELAKDADGSIRLKADKEKAYGQFVRKTISDIDPYDENFGRLRYRFLGRGEQIDTSLGRVSVDADECILYSKGADQSDGRGRAHTATGEDGDLVLWPPLKQFARDQGLID